MPAGNAAVPAPLRATFVGAPPSMVNATLPVGTPAPGATAATVAVNVTLWPNVDGDTGTAASVVVVFALLTVIWTVLLGCPGPVSFDVMAVVWFGPCVPPCTPAITTENVHEPFAGSVPPVREMAAFVNGGSLRTGVIVPAPHEPVTCVDCNRTITTSVSVNDIPVSGIAFGLFTVKLSVLVWPTTIVFGVIDFVMVGGDATVTLALAAVPLPPFVDVGTVVFTV